MCRLLGYQGCSAQTLAAEILDLPNAMLRQSVCDRDVYKPNDDGWGFGFENDGAMTVVKEPSRPHQDPRFRAEAARAHRRVILHIRRASVGRTSAANTHPWTYGDDLIFAHNGSVYGFDKVRDDAMALLPETLRGHVRGETDSEYAMHLFLKNLLARDTIASDDVGSLQAALRETFATLRDLSRRAGAEKEPKLNFMLLTRLLLVATRVIHSLGYYRRDDGVLITSEPLADDDGWTALAENTMIAVRPDARCEILPV